MIKLCSVCLIVLMMALASPAVGIPMKEFNYWEGEWSGYRSMGSNLLYMNFQQEYGQKKVDGTYITYIPNADSTFKEVKGEIPSNADTN